jgi:hypothetical protein
MPHSQLNAATRYLNYKLQLLVRGVINGVLHGSDFLTSLNANFNSRLIFGAAGKTLQ